jgi:hypothetical protein
MVEMLDQAPTDLTPTAMQYQVPPKEQVPPREPVPLLPPIPPMATPIVERLELVRAFLSQEHQRGHPSPPQALRLAMESALQLQLLRREQDLRRLHSRELIVLELFLAADPEYPPRPLYLPVKLVRRFCQVLRRLRLLPRPRVLQAAPQTHPEARLLALQFQQGQLLLQSGCLEAGVPQL